MRKHRRRNSSDKKEEAAKKHHIGIPALKKEQRKDIKERILAVEEIC